ncbi:MAG: dihydrolipoamide acetyltransferase family protein [Mycobacteriales bacterium]
MVAAERVQDFRLPDLGEGLTEGEILRWLVQVGDEVALNQVIVEVETAKAAVELPSPYAGIVTAIHHAAGQIVEVGAPIISIETGRDLALTDMVPVLPREDAGPGAGIGAEAGGRTANLVGYGPRSGTVTRRPRNDRGSAAGSPADGIAVRAKPPVRKLAKELGVSLVALPGTGVGGSVSRADVEAAAREAEQPRVSYDPGSRETRLPVKGVRRHTAAAMVASAFTAPHVTEFVTLDMTATMELRNRVQSLPEFAGVKLSPLLFVAKALLMAVARSPEINSTWDEAAQEIVVKEYVHLGIAAATPRGLLVPVVKDADSLSLAELAHALQDLAETARSGRTAPADLTGGTITITNVGMFGVDSGTPILVPGQAAILCFGAVAPKPWVVDGAVVARQVAQLSLSFDHRIVDGQLGAQFLSDVAAVLRQPGLALVWG